MIKFVLDIGHGFDTYPPDKGIGDFAEFEFNNAVAKYAIPLAKINGFEAVLTQPLDSKDVPLRQRYVIANNLDAELLISVHADANPSPAPNGYWVFHWHNSANGKKLAELWLENANKTFPHNPRPYPVQSSNVGQWNNFGMLRETKQASILIEHAFFTNPSDLKLLKDDNFRKLCAKVIVKTLCDYYLKDFKETDISEKDNADIELLQKLRILNTPEYWIKNAVKGNRVEGEFAAILIQRTAELLRQINKLTGGM